MAKRPGRVYRLVFSDTDPVLPEVVIRIKSLSIAQFLDVQQLATAADRGRDETNADPDRLKHVAAAVKALAVILVERIVNWNIEEDNGTPVPVTEDEVLALDPEAFMKIVEEWLDAVAGVSDPLPSTSSDGPSLEELSMPMETLSASPSS